MTGAQMYTQAIGAEQAPPRLIQPTIPWTLRLVKNLLLLSLVVILLVPYTVEFLSISVFDWVVYPAIFLYFLVGVRYRPAASSRTRSVEAGFVGLLIVALLAYGFGYKGFQNQLWFLEMRGLGTENLFFRLSLYGVMTLILLLVTFRITSLHMSSEDDLKKIVKLAIVVGTINAVITLGYWLYTTGGLVGRYNYLPPLEGGQGKHVTWMGITFLLAFAVWTSGMKLSRSQRNGLVFSMLVSLVSLFTVLVRAGWVTFVIVWLLFMFFSRHRLSSRMRSLTLLFSVLMLVGAIFFVLIQSQGEVGESFQGLLSSDSQDISIRSLLVGHAFDVFHAHPLVGVGYGMYPAYSTQGLFITSRTVYVSSPHNGILLLLAETGILGVLCFAWLAFSVFRQCLRATNLANTPLSKSVATLFFVYFIVLTVMLWVGNGYIALPADRGFTQTVFMFWFFWGICSGIADRVLALRIKDTNQSARVDYST